MGLKRFLHSLIHNRTSGVVPSNPTVRKTENQTAQSFVPIAGNERLSIFSLLCISSNYLCLVPCAQIDGRLGFLEVSFSNSTFAVQTSEPQFLTAKLRIIFELTKSQRGSPACNPLSGLSDICHCLRLAVALVCDRILLQPLQLL